MSITNNSYLSVALRTRDNETIVSILQEKIKKNIATPNESLLCGVVLLMPPFADGDVAMQIFSNLLHGERGVYAAVWDAYRFAVLQPDGSREFKTVLQMHSQSSVAAHMLSMYSSAVDDWDFAITESRRARSLGEFPFNLVRLLAIDPDLDFSEREKIWALVSDLVVDKSYEIGNRSLTVEEVLCEYWNNLITGTHVTSELWEHFEAQRGALGSGC